MHFDQQHHLAEKSLNQQLPLNAFYQKLLSVLFTSLQNVNDVFGSDRSPRSANLRSFVRPVQVCLDQSIFIFLDQRAIRTIRERSGNTKNIQKTIREQSASNQRVIREHWESILRAIRALKSESYSRSLKDFVLLSVR